MAFTFQEIVNMSATKTGREIAAILGIVHPASSNNDEETYLKIEGNRVTRQAKEEVLAGNGHGLYGTKRNSNGNGNSKKEVDSLLKIEDAFVATMARGACMKGGLPETTGQALRDAIESKNKVVLAFLSATLSSEQLTVLEKTIGVLSPAEREAKRRSDLIASISMAVRKAIKVKAMIASIEEIGGTVEMPLWFRDVSSIKPDTLESHSTSELEEIAASMPTA